MNTKYRKNTIRISIKSGKKGQTTHAFIQLNGWGPVCVSERPVVVFYTPKYIESNGILGNNYLVIDRGQPY